MKLENSGLNWEGLGGAELGWTGEDWEGEIGTNWVELGQTGKDQEGLGGVRSAQMGLNWVEWGQTGPN